MLQMLSIVVGITTSIINPKSVKHFQESVDCLSKTMYYEARGEGIEGQLAVAQVVINRATDPLA